LAQSLIKSLESTAPTVAVRLNSVKVGDDCPTIAADAPVVPWCPTGRYLAERPDFTHDPAMHQGVYYVQDASSMVLRLVVQQLVQRLADEGCDVASLRYLDACAAPGGKTTAAIDALPAGALVVANEFDYRRAEILKENVMKWGYPSTVVSRGDTARFRTLVGRFDIVAADVPCSGEGMMRKDDTACAQWSEALVNECATRQREILSNLWCTLRPGGYLIYSTCTFNRRENEEVVEWIQQEYGAEVVAVDVPADSGILVRNGLMRFLPGRVAGEGLFVAVLRKPAGDADGYNLSTSNAVRRSAKVKRPAAADKSAKTTVVPLKELVKQGAAWLTAGDHYAFTLHNDELWAVAKTWQPTVDELSATLDVIHCGVAIGCLKGRSLQPMQGLALSTALNREAFPAVDIDRDTALNYLRREAMGGFDAPRGAVLLTYANRPLGFVNHLGNRSNNLYPANWRILR
jgi:16S rRNA C967 or C1407 C5-methylase (RsmB/RsmF family)/NOL1/NOP2/fmu family ribosome biogenesis protein